MSDERNEVFVYQLRIWIRGISPAIWRRLLVRSDSTIADLHQTLQIAFGWEDWHLHQFLIRGKRYGVTKSGGMTFVDNPRHIQLGDFQFRVRERFVYEYDFYAAWEHEIRVLKRLTMEQKKSYPCCIGGARQGPPERSCCYTTSSDSGPAFRFMQLRQHYSVPYMTMRLLEIIEGDDLETCPQDYQDEIRPFQYWLSAEQFSRQELNERLKQYASGEPVCLWSGGDIAICTSKSK